MNIHFLLVSVLIVRVCHPQLSMPPHFLKNEPHGQMRRHFWNQPGHLAALKGDLKTNSFILNCAI